MIPSLLHTSMPPVRPVLLSLLALSLLSHVSTAHAQECVGMPAGARGVLTYGFEGTDGATGRGLSFAYQTSGSSFLLHHRALDGFTLVDELRTTELQASVRVPGLPVCLVTRGEWTAYDNDRLESVSWNAADPGYKTERHRMGGPYRRLRVPLGIGVGREFRVTERMSIVPFAAPAVVYEREIYTPDSGVEERRTTLGFAARGGITASLNWFVLRSALSHTLTHEYALSSQHNFAELSVQAGVRF